MIREIFASLVQLVRSLCPVEIFRNVAEKLLFHFRCTIFAFYFSIIEKVIFRFSIFREEIIEKRRDINQLF